MGSYLSTGASREWSLVSLDTLERHVSSSMELMADVALRPSFPEVELERLRKQVLDAILQDRANPNATAGRVVRKVLFGGEHPYGWPVGGDEESVKGLAREDLEAFYRTHYTPADACLIMVGDVNLENARDARGTIFLGVGDSENTGTVGGTGRVFRAPHLCRRSTEGASDRASPGHAGPKACHEGLLHPARSQHGPGRGFFVSPQPQPSRTEGL